MCATTFLPFFLFLPKLCVFVYVCVGLVHVSTIAQGAQRCQLSLGAGITGCEPSEVAGAGTQTQVLCRAVDSLHH